VPNIRSGANVHTYYPTCLAFVIPVLSFLAFAVPNSQIKAKLCAKTLMFARSILKKAFEEASRLCVGMQFETWDHVDLVLLAYRQQQGFVWRIKNKYLNKNGGVYKYVFECQHAGKYQPKKAAIPSKYQLFLDQDLANIIQYFQRANVMGSDNDPKNDASNLLKTLQKMKEDDSA
ncbi:29196_t:CDS:2, partial [Racocetra persica]